MEQKEIIETLSNYSDEIIGVKVTEDTDILEEQIFDSMELVTFLNEIEEEFDVTITIDEFQEKGLGNIGKLANFIKEAMS